MWIPAIRTAAARPPGDNPPTPGGPGTVDTAVDTTVDTVVDKTVNKSLYRGITPGVMWMNWWITRIFKTACPGHLRGRGGG